MLVGVWQSDGSIPSVSTIVNEVNMCNHAFKKGMAIINGWSGMNDFVGEKNNVVTVSLDPKLWRLVEVDKCYLCGFSLSK